MVSRASCPQNFFALAQVCVLASPRKPSKFESQMASSLEDLVTKFEIFYLMMNKVLDKVHC